MLDCLAYTFSCMWMCECVCVHVYADVNGLSRFTAGVIEGDNWTWVGSTHCAILNDMCHLCLNCNSQGVVTQRKWKNNTCRLMLHNGSTADQRTDVKWRFLPAEIVFELQIFEVRQEQFSEVSFENSHPIQSCQQWPNALPTTRASFFFSAN